MTVVDDTVAEFGRSLGLDELRLRANGSVVLALESIGTLAIDLAGPNRDAVIVSLTRPLARPTVDHRRLLAATHFRNRTRLPMQVGVRDGHLVLAIILSAEDFTLPKINEAIHVLDREHQRLEFSP